MPENYPVAIIGIGCLFPKANSLKEYWHLIYHGKDAISEIPESHWSPSDYFDPDPEKPDHVYCQRGGFLSPISFDPSEFGIPPTSLEAIDSSQLLGLLAAKMALEDCGYGDGQNFDRDRTSVILGVTGTQELVIPLSTRLGHPQWRKTLEQAEIPPDKSEEIIQNLSESYVSWQENSFPGLLGNVVAGRICNRLDLRGTNCVVDAACASSMSAVHLAILELLTGRSDLVVTGGVDTLNDIFMHMCFSKTHTLSLTGDARPFSKAADGTVLGEGIGMLVLKRLREAERDGNRIYAVIKGLGSSSDGKSQSIYSPSAEGQTKALYFAYKNAGIDPATVELIEAHGTGTRVGDSVEFQALREVFEKTSKNGGKCALGSVKSMIGHTKAAAGAAGLIKAALGLHHKVLLPTLKAEQPDPNLGVEGSPFYLNTHSRPWLSNHQHLRRAGVSAFGFGGSNFHVVLEEYHPTKAEISWDGSVEIISFSAIKHDELIRQIKHLKKLVQGGLSDQEFSVEVAESRKRFSADHPHRILMVSERDSNKSDLLSRALNMLVCKNVRDTLDLKNIYFGNSQRPGKIAFVFPGQGSQYVMMGRDYICTFPEALEIIENANKSFKNSPRLSDLIFPPGSYSTEDRKRHEHALRKTNIAQPAIGVISLAMLKVLQRFKLTPDATCGHSFGELAALCAAGWIKEDAFLNLAIIRGHLMANAGSQNHRQNGAMLAVKASLEELESLIAANKDITLANRNSPKQGVLSGPLAAIKEFETTCRRKGFNTIRLPVSAAFHSPLMQNAHQPFLSALKSVQIRPTSIKVFSNTTGDAYPHDPDQTRVMLADHLMHPVDFVSEIENLYRSGVRTFVEVGPKSVLAGLICDILHDQPFQAVALDASSGKGYGVADLARLLCRLAAIGFPLALHQWENPPSSVRKPQMKIHLTGANYRDPKTKNKNQGIKKGNNNKSGINYTLKTKRQRISNNSLKPVNNLAKQSSKKPKINKQRDTMAEDNKIKSDLILDALKVVQEGLKSMQALQFQTALTHQKFLEAQAEANRTLQEMMKNTQRLAEKSLGIKITPPSGPSLPQHPFEPPHKINLNQPIIDTSDSHISFPESLDAQELPSYISDPDLLKAAANGYESETIDPVSKINETEYADLSRKEIDTTMLAVVSQLTGYPVEMLGLDMDIEADLGIDSIKRVEILSTLEEKLPGLPSLSPDILGSLKTLGQIAEYLADAVGGEADKGYKEKPLRDPAISSAENNAEPAGLSRKEIDTTMLAVVSQLTGYPVEMLGLDMDIEADLGIDSIKRVEILSTLEEKLPGLPSVTPDVMTSLRTLGQIAAYLVNTSSTKAFSNQYDEGQSTALPAVSKDRTEAEGDLAQLQTELDTEKIPRSIVSVVNAPDPAGAPISIPSRGKIFITEDNTGLSEKISHALLKSGLNTIKISLDILKYKKELPEAAGLIIVQDPSSQHMDEDLKAAFALTKYMAPNLVSFANEGGALFATITRLDGAFGFNRANVEHPKQGGLAGLAKTAASEWEKVCCHAIDIAPTWQDNDEIAKAVAKEILSPGPIEIGLNSAYRCTLALEPRPHPRGQLDINPGDIFVISGGARGITAAAALALAKYAQPTLVLIGRTPNPISEPEWVSSANDEASMKKLILENEFFGHAVSPAQIEKAYKKHTANHEIAKNLAELRLTGSNVYYYSADIRDTETVQSIIDEIHSFHGPVAGLIHGAGVLEDRLIMDKTTEQFERVYDTKVKGLDNLLQATRDDDLKHIVLFSSISARLGNKGQVDYAMANEVVNKVAMAESAKRPDCRVVSINWGPWDGGMVNATLKREFERNGIQLIPSASGASCMLSEMMADDRHSVEVVVGAKCFGDPIEDLKKRSVTAKPIPIKKTQALSLAFERNIDIKQYPILKSHVIDGRPVVPMALMTEWFAHSALHENPGLVLNGLDDIRILKGVRLEDDKQLIRIFAGKAIKTGEFYEVQVELRDGRNTGQEVIHSRAKAILSDRLTPAPEFKLSNRIVTNAYKRAVEEIYDKILFHGLQLRGIRNIVSCSSQGMVAHISPAPSPREWISAPFRNHWISDPLVLDCAFQMATLWCFEENGVVSLPSYGASYRQYCNQFPSENVTVVLEVTEVTNRKMQGSFTFLDTNQKVVATFKGYEAIMDVSLLKAFKPQVKASA